MWGLLLITKTEITVVDEIRGYLETKFEVRVKVHRRMGSRNANLAVRALALVIAGLITRLSR